MEGKSLALVCPARGFRNCRDAVPPRPRAAMPARRVLRAIASPYRPVAVVVDTVARAADIPYQEMC